MPPGYCVGAFSSSEFPADRYSRIAEVTVQTRGITRTLHLAGMADAHFPEREPQDNSPLRAGQSLRVVWRDAIFHGHDRIFGPVTASIPRGFAAAAGVVQSLSAPQSGRDDPSEADFFPALNVNTFDFHIAMPRFGLNLRSRTPIENRAEIREIPPFGAVYELTRTVSFAPVVSRSNSFAAALAGETVISACNVKLILVGGMTVALTLVNDDGDIATFDCTVTNTTEVDSVETSWFVWPRPEDETFPLMGTLSLRRDPLTFRLRFPRDIFFMRRWIVFAVAKPFSVNEGAGAARFPPLR